MNKLFSKAKVALFLVVALVFTLVMSGCGSLAGAMVGGFKGERSLTLSSKKLGMEVRSSLTCDFSIYFNEKFDFSKEYASLRKFCFISLMDAHDIGVASFDFAPNDDEKDNKAFLEAMGFDGITQILVGEGETEDPKDTVSMVISKKLVGYNSKNYPKYFVSVSLCGTDGSNEWESDFDFGSTTSDYTGTHSMWTNKDNHKGFDVAANRVIEEIYNYMCSDTGLALGDVVIAISGYSRGAAVGNLVCAKLDDDISLIPNTGAKVVAYNFATPRTTTYSDCHKALYNNIHNYNNTDDIITSLPTETMGFERYGQDHSFSIQNNETIKAKYNAFVDNVKANNPSSLMSYYNAGCADTVRSVFNGFLTDRNNVYTVIEDEAHKTWKIDDKNNETPEAAQAAGDAFLQEMNEKGVGQYFKDAGITEVTYEKDEGYAPDGTRLKETKTYYVWNCYVGDGVLCKVFNTIISKTMEGNADQALNDRYLMRYSRHESSFFMLLLSIASYPTYINDSHFPLAYYIACVQE